MNTCKDTQLPADTHTLQWLGFPAAKPGTQPFPWAQALEPALQIQVPKGASQSKEELQGLSAPGADVLYCWWKHDVNRKFCFLVHRKVGKQGCN